jgi:arylformamidase
MQQKAQPRGPLVWRDMDQRALDRAYDQGVYAPNRDQVLGRIAAASERARKSLGATQRVANGPSEHERLDIYRAAAPACSSAARGSAKDRGAPVNVFVHGGAWRGSSAAEKPSRPRRSWAPALTQCSSTSSMSIRRAAI